MLLADTGPEAVNESAIIPPVLMDVGANREADKVPCTVRLPPTVTEEESTVSPVTLRSFCMVTVSFTIKPFSKVGTPLKVLVSLTIRVVVVNAALEISPPNACIALAVVKVSFKVTVPLAVNGPAMVRIPAKSVVPATVRELDRASTVLMATLRLDACSAPAPTSIVGVVMPLVSI